MVLPVTEEEEPVVVAVEAEVTAVKKNKQIELANPNSMYMEYMHTEAGGRR